MVKCVVPSCKNDSKTTYKSQHSISFHRFPKNETLFKNWTAALNTLGGSKKYWKPNFNSRVCSVHFDPIFYTETKKGLRKLDKNALPVFNLQEQEVDDKEFDNEITTPFNEGYIPRDLLFEDQEVYNEENVPFNNEIILSTSDDEGTQYDDTAPCNIESTMSRSNSEDTYILIVQKLDEVNGQPCDHLLYVLPKTDAPHGSTKNNEEYQNQDVELEDQHNILHDIDSIFKIATKGDNAYEICRNDTPQEIKLKRQIKHLTEIAHRRRLRCNALHMQKNRLEKKVVSLKKMLAEFKKRKDKSRT